MTIYQKVYEHLLTHPDQSLQSIGKIYGLYPENFKRNIERLYGYDFDARLARIKKQQEDHVNAMWPKMRKALDSENCKYFEIATRYGVTKGQLQQLIKQHGYDLYGRANRIRRIAGMCRPKTDYNGKKPISYVSESIAGEMSLQAHTLPFKEWGGLAA